MSLIQIYAAGGAGINIIHAVEEELRGHEGFAELKVAYIDTSRSNTRSKNISDSKTYIFEGVDGSGKKRDANYKEISERSKEILLEFKPADFNIVVHSTSGGSGSVIGPVLVSEMLNREIPLIVLTVGNKDSRAEIENTLNTIKSYQVISQKKQKPVVMSYYENNADTPRNFVDKQVQMATKIISAVFSGKNEELDRADLTNFLDFTKRSTHEPTLARLDFYSGKVTLDRGQVVPSMVTLSRKGEDTSPGIPVDYQAVGFITNEVENVINIDTPVHLVTVVGYYAQVIDSLNKELSAIDEIRKSVVTKAAITNADLANATDDGLVL